MLSDLVGPELRATIDRALAARGSKGATMALATTTSSRPCRAIRRARSAARGQRRSCWRQWSLTLGAPAEVVAALLLGDDLLQRDALLAWRSGDPTAVLTREQAAGEAPLPDFLVGGRGVRAGRHAGDGVWSAWFRHAAGVGRRRGSRFLQAWVGHEVALRNALAAARAKALGLDRRTTWWPPTCRCRA